jgi:hypothetical protein
VDVDSLRWNEKLKAVSAVATNLGSGLLAAAFGRWFVVGFDAYVSPWLFGAAMMLWAGLHILRALEVDDVAG